MDSLPTDIYSIFVQYVNVNDVFNISKINKKFHQRIWKNAAVWSARKLSLHKERNLDIPKHLLYCYGKKPIEILKHTTKYGHDVLFLQLFRRLLDTVRTEGTRIHQRDQGVFVGFNEIYQEMCHTLDLAYYYILIGPYTDILSVLLDETIDFIPDISTSAPNFRKHISISYGNVIYKEKHTDRARSTVYPYSYNSIGYGSAIFLSIYHGKYDTARIFLEKGPVILPFHNVSHICDKLLMHPDIYLKLLKYDELNNCFKILLHGCHKLARIDILDTLIEKSKDPQLLIIYRVTLKKLIKEKKYDYIMHFMKVCYIKTIKDVIELSDDKLRERIRKNKKLMMLKAIATRFSVKLRDDSDSDSGEEEKTYDDVCRGKTRNGKNCTRKITKRANNQIYCWQHRKQAE